MSEDTKQKVMGKINEIKSNIESFVSDINVNELKASINSMVKDAQKDLNKLIDKDLDSVKRKLQKEKDDFEAKAKKFLDGHKKELTTLQAKFDKLVKATSKLKAKKGPKVAKDAPTSKKKVIKKVAKVKAAAKPGFKTTKKKASAKSAQA
jgi:hypothetical protein